MVDRVRRWLVINNQGTESTQMARPFKGILSCIIRDIGEESRSLDREAEWKPWKMHETEEWELTEPDTPAVGGK